MKLKTIFVNLGPGRMLCLTLATTHCGHPTQLELEIQLENVKFEKFDNKGKKLLELYEYIPSWLLDLLKADRELFPTIFSLNISHSFTTLLVTERICNNL